MPDVLNPITAGIPLSSTEQNENWESLEAKADSIDGRMVVSGLTLSAGSGLQAVMAAGVAILKARLAFSQTNINALAPSTTTYCWLNADGTVSQTASTTPPVGQICVLLGSVTTNGSAVTGTDTSIAWKGKRVESDYLSVTGPNALTIAHNAAQVAIGTQTLESGVALTVSGLSKQDGVGFPERGAKPTRVANRGFVYVKDSGGVSELFYSDDDSTLGGRETQLTSAGASTAAQVDKKLLYALMRQILGTPRGVWPFEEGSGASVASKTLTAHALVPYEATASSTLTAFDTDPVLLGPNYYYDLNGTDEWLKTADHADFEFGSGTADSAFSVGCVAYLDSVASAMSLVAKWDVNSGSEKRAWRFGTNGSGKPILELYDESVDKNPYFLATSALTVSTWYHIVATYSGAGGATAASGIALYVNGVAVAGAATNDASYVAMEDLSCALAVGANENGTSPGQLLNGRIAFPWIAYKELTAEEVYDLYLAESGVLGV